MINPQIRYFKKCKERLDYKLSHLEDIDEIERIKRKMNALYFRERAIYTNDLIQPDDKRFKTLYKEEWLKSEKEKEEAERKKKRIKKEREQFYKDNMSEGKSRVSNALDLEDKIRYA